MAKEINATVNLNFSKTGAKSIMAVGPVQIDMAGSKYAQGVQAIGITDEAIGIGDVSTTPGLCVMQNLDATNYVEIGVDGTNYVIKLKPGEPCLFRVDGTAIHAKANTAPINLQYLVIQD